MKLNDIIHKLNCKVLCGEDKLETEVTGGYCSDLLSDVMGNASEGQVWITVQVHKNIVAVASLKEVSAILLVKGLTPLEDTLEAAKEEGITVLQTEEPAFEVAGKMYKLLSTTS